MVADICKDNRKIYRITVDLDSYKDVSRALVKALEIFDINQLKLYQTPSGTGFRLEIRGEFTPIEDIYYRTVLEDDPYRLRFALRRYLGTGEIDLLDISFDEKEQIGGYYGRAVEIDIKELIDDIMLEEIKKRSYTVENIYKVIEERLLKYVKKITLWTIVIPAEKRYIELIRDNFRKYKILKDPYYDDRVIFYKVSNENLVEKFERLGIPIITYKTKEITTKNIDLSEEI
jgi:hypothetical protein